MPIANIIVKPVTKLTVKSKGTLNSTIVELDGVRVPNLVGIKFESHADDTKIMRVHLELALTDVEVEGILPLDAFEIVTKK